MLFAVGSKVKFLHSADTGRISAILPNQMVMVELDDINMEIPVSTNDLILDNDHVLNAQKVVPPPPSSNPEQPKVTSNKSTTPSGIVLLAFVPDTASRFSVVLINHSVSELVYDFKLFILNRKSININGKLDPNSNHTLGYMLKDHLNDSPAVQIGCWTVTSQGPGPVQKKTLKIKGKSFFKKFTTIPSIGANGYVYELFTRLPAEVDKDKGASLKRYTRQQLNNRPPETEQLENLIQLYDVNRRATFPQSIDLHIEKLTPHHKKMEPAEILAIQISRFKDYLAQAIQAGVPYVYIVHGKGKGRLRNKVVELLDTFPEVTHHEGGYHAGYGFGATKVLFE